MISLFTDKRTIASITFGASLFFLNSMNAFAFDDDSEEHEEISDKVVISKTYADNAGIKNNFVQAGSINQTITLYGKAVTDGSNVSHIRARFAGMIRKLTLSIGDSVKKGEVVAEIESSSSLKTYQVKAPITGTVTARFANENELADGQVLLTITNTEKLWLELQVFPSQKDKVSLDKKVIVTNDHAEIQSSISYFLPSANNQPFIIARVPLNNQEQLFSAGLLLKGNVVTNYISADLVVENSAIQMVDGKSSIFVKTTEGYQVRPIILGRSDGRFSEVLSGLQRDEKYALENSYLLKAELDKSLAAHDDH